MTLRIGNVPHSENVKPNTGVEKTQEERELFETCMQNNEQGFQAQEAKYALVQKIYENLDLENNFLKVSFDGEYLVLSRPANDELRSNKRRDFNMGAIKNKLGVKDGVISSSNDMKDITGRLLYENSDDGVLEPGKSIKIPLSELGKDFSWYQFRKKGLLEYVEKYLNTSQ